MDKFNALYTKVKLAELSAERDEARKEAEREAETRWMLRMVNRSSDNRNIRRQKERRHRFLALLRKLDIAEGIFTIAAIVAFTAFFALLCFRCWGAAVWFAFGGCLMVLVSAVLSAWELAAAKAARKVVRK